MKNIKIANYFSTGYILLGILFLLIGISAIVLGNIILGVILILATLIISTSHYRLKIDPSTHRFKFYIWFLGFAVGKEQSYDNIEYIFLKKNQVSQTMHMESLTSTVKSEVYDLFLKFSNRETLHLLSKKNYEEASIQLKSIASEFNLETVDYMRA